MEASNGWLFSHRIFLHLKQITFFILSHLAPEGRHMQSCGKLTEVELAILTYTL